MGCRDRIGVCEVSNRARKLQHSMVGPRGKTEPCDSLLQERLASGISATDTVDLFGAKLCVRFTLPDQLPRAGGGDSLAHRRRRLARRLPHQFFLRNCGHFDVNIDAIEQWSRELPAITRHLVGRTVAFAIRMSKKTAWARVHRRHELEARGEIGLAGGARDGDVPRFERLAQYFEDP